MSWQHERRNIFVQTYVPIIAAVLERLFVTCNKLRKRAEAVRTRENAKWTAAVVSTRVFGGGFGASGDLGSTGQPIGRRTPATAP